MLPRRSLRLRLRQLNGQNASHSIASSVTNETSKPIAKTAKKRARTESSESDADTGNQPKQKKIKLFKHDLESFPTEILEEIFIRCGDVGLLNLAKTCTRFEAIAQTVFSQKYADKFFLINDEYHGGDPEIYAALFDSFGGHIKAIQLNHIKEDESTAHSAHWALKIIQSHINRIEKLTYNACTFKPIDILSQPLKNATHLVFRENNDVNLLTREEFDMPECRNLVEFEIFGGTFNYTNQSLYRTIRNNPALQRVILRYFYMETFHQRDTDHLSIINLIVNHLTDIKELALYDTDYRDWGSPLSASEIDRIVNSFKHLESLSINADDDNMLELLPHLARACKSLKHLGLFEYIDGKSIPPFEQIESLHVVSYCASLIQSSFPGEHFPNLRHLTIDMFDYDDDRFSDLLPFIHQCQSLQKITIVPEDWGLKNFIAAESFEKFIEATIVANKPNFQIDVACDVGSVTANGVVWRNKLMYWTDCGRNDTNIRLLDLASHSMQSDATKEAADQTNLLDKICEYLDLESLAALAEMNDQSKRLANNYVKKRAKAQKSFLITDEFHGSGYFHKWTNFATLKSVRLITDLSIICRHNKHLYFIKTFIESCKLLNKLSIFDKSSHARWSILQTNLSLVVYDSSFPVGYDKLMSFIYYFPRIETIECKNAGSFSDFKSIGSHTKKLGQLKKFTFNYRGETQMKNLKKIFENTTVQLVPIHQN